MKYFRFIKFDKTQDSSTPKADDTAAPATETKTPTDADALDLGDFGKALESGINQPAPGGQGQPAGGTGDGASSPAGSSSPSEGAAPEGGKTPKTEEAAAVEPAAEPAKRKYKIGKKEFDSADEMQAYIDGLSEAQLSGIAPAKVDEPPKVKFEDVVYEDPAKAKALLKEEIMSEINADNQARDRKQKERAAADKNWQKFYKQHPDLVGFEDEVKQHLPGVTQELGENTHVDKAFPVLAKKVREHLKNIADRFAPAQELPSAPATTSGTSANQVPPAPKKEDGEPLSFADQVKKLNRKGRLVG
jgi:hypothetical protein